MSSDSIFGGTALLPAHFESAVAKAVFNDKSGDAAPKGVRASIESRLMAWIAKASPRQIILLAPKIDMLIVPVLSPAGFRRLCSFLCENLPQVIEKMPHVRESVIALARAVHVSKLINPASLRRIQQSLKLEGLTKD